MNTNNLNTALYEKMATEQEKYRDWLKSQPPEEILHHTYEYTVREDIVMAMEELELTDAQAQALLESPSPLADVYRYFEKLETGYMDVIRDSIENRADDVCRAKEELRTTPVYPHSAAYASEHGEMAQYNLSYQANSACKEAIEQTISAHYAENRLDTEAAVKDVLEKFGTERVQFILANTIQRKNYDGRISQDNKAWAKTLQDGGQLLSYVQQEGTTQFVSLYASDLVDSTVQAKYYLISLKDNDELVATLEQDSDASILTFREAKTRTVETIYQAWKQIYNRILPLRAYLKQVCKLIKLAKLNIICKI